MSTKSFKIKDSINLEPQAASSIDQTGDMAFNNATDSLEYRDSAGTRTVVNTETAQTLNNKTLNQPEIGAIQNGAGTLTLPTTTDTLVGRATTDTLTNKTISGSDNTLSNINITSTNLSTATSVGIATTNTASTVNIGTGTGANTINLGGANSTINFNGTVNNNNVTNLNVTDKLITINDGGGAASGGSAGIEVEENGSATGYLQTSTDRNSWQFKAPNAAGVATLSPGASNDDVVLRQASQTLTNKTLTTPVISQISNTGTLTLPTSTDTLVGRNTTDTLTNKTLTSASLTTPSTDVVTLDGQASAPSNPSSGFYKMYVSDTTQKLTILNSAGVETAVGGGAGGINYLSANPDAEAGTTGWATYADAASSRPTDGTGGSPNITWTTSNTTPLRGNAEFILTKDAANRQGQGVSYAFTIDRADLAKPLDIRFDYELLSGTFSGSTTPATDSDVIVYLYDVTNATLIEPAGRLLEPLVTGQTYRYRGTFQTASNSQSYRLILHVASTSASAYTLGFDNFYVGPQVVSNGAVVNDWQSYTPTASGLTNATWTGRWRRVGDSMECQIRGIFAGAATGSSLSLSIPSGFSIDTTKIPNVAFLHAVNGGGFLFDTSASAYFGLYVGYNSTTDVFISYDNGTNGQALAVTATAPVSLAANDTISISFEVPIAGWSSNVQMSNDTDTRVVAFRAFQTASQTGINPNNSSVKLTFGGTERDSHGSYSTTNSRFTAPVSGFYTFSALITINATNVLASSYALNLWKNGTFYSGMNGIAAEAGRFFSLTGSLDAVFLNAGEYVEVYLYGLGNNSASTLSSDSTVAYFSGVRSSGPSQVAASEVVAARYRISANRSPSAAAAIDYDTRIIDTHNAVTTGSSWRFTAPVAGLYKISAVSLTTAAVTASLLVYKNSVAEAGIGTLNTTNVQAGASTLVSLNAGDSIHIGSDGAGVTYNSASSGLFNQIHIERLGGR